MKALIAWAVDHPSMVSRAMVLVSLFFLLLVTLPSLWPQTFSALHPLKVDTDPENMLPRDEPVRVFHNRMKREFTLYDMVVVGVVNDVHPDGIFNPDSLAKIYELTEFAKRLRWEGKSDPAQRDGVIGIDIISSSTVDNIEQAGPGAIRFDWLMPEPPKDREAALAVRAKAERIPFLQGTMISGDGRALALYLPLTAKDVSYRVARQLKDKIASMPGDEQFFVTGLPVAEDTFGVEMFIQMAICAPLAMLVVFLLMVYFFRNIALVGAAMAVAMVSVICAMGLLIGTGHTVHIMSSMIPIFIMPIAVLDSIHILSEFFDRYRASGDRRATILAVMDTLFTPMLFTSLTTAAGFASLALTPIPPVQVFGLFVAFGVMVAWLCSITFIPAVVMMLSPKALRNYGMNPADGVAVRSGPRVGRLLNGTGRQTHQHAKLIILGAAAISILSVYGISRIRINDNPVKWFSPSHEIRVADRVLNEHFGGTYMAYLALQAAGVDTGYADYVEGMRARLRDALPESGFGSLSPARYRQVLEGLIDDVASGARSRQELLDRLEYRLDQRYRAASGDEREIRDSALLFVDRERQRDHVFKQPGALAYIQSLQEHLVTTGIVGKSNSVADIVRTMNRELHSGEERDLRIPATADGVAQTMMTFQTGHRPGDLWHFITPDYRKASIWVQMKSGDNRDMTRVVEETRQFMADNPPPYSIQAQWFGLTYLNVIWQEKMVSGMLTAFLGSFVVVWLMMTFLFRSVLWGLLCLIPLMLTIGLIYGVIGLIGKDYDMPIAVLSALSLGLAVDYAIHFVARTRRLHAQHGTWANTIGPVFGEPARAISRNAVVNGVGFLPLLLAPLVPYQTVGVFIAAILFTAGVASLVLLPALVTVLEPRLFDKTR